MLTQIRRLPDTTIMGIYVYMKEKMIIIYRYHVKAQVDPVRFKKRNLANTFLYTVIAHESSWDDLNLYEYESRIP